MDRAVQRLEPLDEAFDGDVMEIYVICLTFDGDDGDMSKMLNLLNQQFPTVIFDGDMLVCMLSPS